MKVILSTPPKSSSKTFSPPPSPLTARSRLARWRDYLECSPGKALALAAGEERGGYGYGRRRRNFFDYVSALMLVLAMCLFLAFLAWMAIFIRRRAEEMQQLQAERGQEEDDFIFGDDYGRDRRPFSQFDRTR